MLFRSLHAADMHSCHNHKHENNAADSIQEHSIGIVEAPPGHHEQKSQCGRHCDEHKEDGYGHHPKAKDHITSLTDCSRGSCHGTMSSKICESRGEDVCSSRKVGHTGVARQCCRTSARSCCSHSMLKLTEIVVE